MALTTVQLQQFKAAILAETGTIPSGQPWSGSFAGMAVKDVPNTGDGNIAVAGWYNLPAVPGWTVWKKSVPLLDVGNNLNGTELAGLTSVNHTRLQTVVMLSANGVDASLADRRQFFDDIFSGAGGTTTRAQLLVLWKRLATRCQKLYSSGTGSDASPATTNAGVGDTFAVNGPDVANAYNA